MSAFYTSPPGPNPPCRIPTDLTFDEIVDLATGCMLWRSPAERGCIVLVSAGVGRLLF